MTNVLATPQEPRPTDPCATIAVSWECPYLTHNAAKDIVQKFTIKSSPAVGDQVCDCVIKALRCDDDRVAMTRRRQLWRMPPCGLSTRDWSLSRCASLPFLPPSRCL